MQKSVRKSLLKTVSLGLCVLLALCSCATVGGEGEEEVQVLNAETGEVVETVASSSIPDGWLNSLGTIDGLNVVRYRIRGVGPEGASFDWIDVTSSKVALSDIRRGEWTIYGQAISETGEVVAKGSITTFLSSSTPLGAVYLDSTEGVGDVNCDFSWSTSQILYPEVEVYTQYEGGEFVSRDASEIEITENGKAVWKAEGLEAGPYVVRAILKDEGEVVSGIAAALRVIDGKTSVGDIKFTVGKLSTVYGISLENTPEDSVVGELVLDGNIVSYNTDRENVRHMWFMNGEILDCRESSIDITSLLLKKGYYRFDVIVNGSDINSINSATIFVFVNGNEISVVNEEEADSKKGDVPKGYDEVSTVSQQITMIEPEEDTGTPTEVIIEIPAEEPVTEALADPVTEMVEAPSAPEAPVLTFEIPVPPVAE